MLFRASLVRSPWTAEASVAEGIRAVAGKARVGYTSEAAVEDEAKRARTGHLQFASRAFVESKGADSRHCCYMDGRLRNRHRGETCGEPLCGLQSFSARKAGHWLPGLWLSLLAVLLATPSFALQEILVLKDACPYAKQIAGRELYPKLRIFDRFRAPNGAETWIVSARGNLDWRAVQEAATSWCGADRLLPLRRDPQLEVLVVECRSVESTRGPLDMRRNSSLAAWTMVKLRSGQSGKRVSNSERTVPQTLLSSWIMHHAKAGIREFIVYLNDADACDSGATRLKEMLTEHLANVPVRITMIAWPFIPPAGVHWNHVQIAAMNDCLWRYREIHKWILFADVDEYIIPSAEALQLSPSSPVLHVIESISSQLPINLCSIRVPSWSRYDMVEPALNWSSVAETPLRGPWIGATAPVDRVCKPHLNREKCFIQTDMVYYLAVHSVAEAYDAPCVQVWPDVHRHLRMEHRRMPRAPDDLSPTEVLYPS